MDSALHAISLWLHILGIALFVGPQFFLALAWGPAARGISDQGTRLALTRTLTKRFGYIGGIGIVLIVLAGTYLIMDWRDYYAIPEDTEFTSLRFGVLFIVKMTLFLVMLAVVGFHMFFVGPGLVRAMEEQQAGSGSDEAVRAARVRSMAVSILGLALALGIMVLGVLMNTVTFSLRDA